jgi:hypothetical protein
MHERSRGALGCALAPRERRRGTTSQRTVNTARMRRVAASRCFPTLPSTCVSLSPRMTSLSKGSGRYR